MTREELFEHIQKINDPEKDYGKVLTNLHYTHYYLMDEYKKVLMEYDLTFIQSNILAIILQEFPNALSLEEIKSMVLEPGADVSRTVERLADKGFVEKVLDSSNRRKLSIVVTPKGMKTSKKIQLDPGFKRFSTKLNLSESKALIKLLSKLRED